MKTPSSLNASNFDHLPVLSNEVLKSIDQLPSKLLDGGLIIDATIGGGGHSGLILEAHPHLQLIGIDQDPYANSAAKKHLLQFKERVQIIEKNFADFHPPQPAAFVLADLGVSSPQFDQAERGFSFRLDGPIDMRMNPMSKTTAADLLENLEEQELANLIYTFGEERFSRRIASKIKKDLKSHGPYPGTKALAYAIAGCYPGKLRYGRIHPATKTFQALRLAINNELDALDKFLNNVPGWLKEDGLVNIISFHSLEDRMVKIAFKNNKSLERVNRKPLRPNSHEIGQNPRSRSAKLRIARKITD